MRFVRPLLLTLLLAPLAHEAQAQPPLTLDAAVSQAMARNPALAAARAGAVEAAARVDQSRSGYFPQLSIVESWQRGNAPVFVFSSLLSARQFAAGNFAIDALNQPGAVGFFHGAVAVDQVVFDGGRTRAAVAASRQMARMADASSAEAELGVVSQVAATYGRLLSLDAAHRAAESAAAAAVEDVARAERRRDAGRVTEADVLALRVHLAAMRVRSIEVFGQAAVARAELNRLRGEPVDAEFTVTEPPLAAPAARDWAALAAEAQAARPDLARAAAALELAGSGRRQARAAWWPQVAAQAAYQYDGLDLSRRASAWVLGGEVRWSFATGQGDRAAGRAAAAAEIGARAALEDARAAVQVEVLNAVRTLESAEAREALARATVAQARESERIIRDRYDAGLVGVQDVLGAASAVLGAESMRMTTLTDRITARAALDRAVGRRP